MEETTSGQSTGIIDALTRTGVKTDRLLGALANKRRRETLTYLNQGHTPVGLQDLAEHLTATGDGQTPVAADPDHLAIRQRLFI